MSLMGSGEDVTVKEQELILDLMPMINHGDPSTGKHEITRESSTKSHKSTLDLIFLTLGFGGLQGVFAVQFGNGSEYLTSLGLSKPAMSLVWLAGPISGAVLQPFFCLRSDECQSKWGRRKPFIVGGSLAIILSLFGQAWAPDLISSTTYVLLGIEQQSELVTKISGATVVVFVVSLNIAVQPVQGCLRALIMDSCPKDQQGTANAWAGRIISITNVLSYFCGYIDLPHLLPYLGRTQFKVLCFITSILLGISIAITCWAVKERPATWDEPDINSKEGTLRKLSYLSKSFRNLPPQVQRVCMVQFFAWMGWFPFLFYVDLYIRNQYSETSSTHRTQSKLISEELASKMGSLGMTIFAIISLFASIAIPTLVRPSGRFRHHHRSFTLLSRWRVTISTWMSSICHLWMLSHILYAICMLATMLISSISGTYVLVGVVGISWAVTIWAPYAIINTAVLDGADIHKNDDTIESEGLGVVIGLHNIAIAVPQIIAALLCSFVFLVFDGSGPATTEDSVGWVLRIGGLSTLVATFLTTRLNEGVEDEEYKLKEMQYT